MVQNVAFHSVHRECLIVAETEQSVSAIFGDKGAIIRSLVEILG